ncbi:MAG: hypothetical protein ACWGMZ_02895 [Thermoguttaceae bacterium]
MRNEPSVAIRLDGEGRNYHSGESLSGEYVFTSLLCNQIQAVEVSVLWFTEGKGDEDMAVHAFWRLEPEKGDFINPLQPTPFETVLPNSPLSHDGQIVKIHWCLRVRAFLHRGKEVFGQKEFRLENAPSSAAAVSKMQLEQR